MRLIALAAVFLFSFISHAQKYKKVDLQEITKPSSTASTLNKVDAQISAAVIEALGADIIFKSGGNRVLSTNENGSIIEIGYFTNPALIGPRNVTKDGIFIDVLRLAQELIKTKSIKSSKAKTLLLRPFVITAEKAIESVAKIEINLSSLKKAKLSSLDGAVFEKWIQNNGKVSYAPYLINNGGKFLILKSELLDL